MADALSRGFIFAGSSLVSAVAVLFVQTRCHLSMPAFATLCAGTILVVPATMIAIGVF